MCNCGRCEGVIDEVENTVIGYCDFCGDAILETERYGILANKEYCNECLKNTGFEVIEMLGGEIYGS